MSGVDPVYSDDQLLNVREVAALTRLSKPTIYKFIAERRFPRQVHLGSHRVVWLRSEVLAWIAHRAGQRECR
jgi:prophage regulatory protein